MKLSHSRKWLINFAHVAALALPASAAYAETIPGGTTSADDLLLNFDLTGLNSQYPYSKITLNYFLNVLGTSGCDQGGSNNSEPVTVDIFSGLDGSESLLQTSTVAVAGSCAQGPPY